MAEAVRKFFEKKKRDAKFKTAGPGHKLSEEKAPEKKEVEQNTTKRSEPCSDARQAGMAALARFEASTSSTPGFSSLQSLENCSRSSIVKERTEVGTEDVSEKEKARSHLLAVQGVFYRCPQIGPEVLTKEEWRAKIKSYLDECLKEERGLTACLIIRSCNKNKDKVDQCVKTLGTYLENIINHPNEDKYKKIRVSNKVFQDKVSKFDGTLNFLKAAGFESKNLDLNGVMEEFLEYNPEISNEENLKMLLDALKNSEAIKIELDRNLQVLLPSQACVRVQLPQDFYNLTSDEIKREQQLRSERLNDSFVLKTKAMREKEEQREMKKYKFVVIRIRFPDGIFLQGTFGIYEKLDAVREFVRENLLGHGNFILTTGLGQQFSETDYDSSLLDLHLVPASILIFAGSCDEEVSTFLKPEVLQLIQTL